MSETHEVAQPITVVVGGTVRRLLVRAGDVISVAVDYRGDVVSVWVNGAPAREEVSA